MDPYAWSWNPEALLVVPLLTVAYLVADSPAPRAVVADRLLPRRDGAPRRRDVSPVHTLAVHYLLTVHLLQNVVLAEWAPLLVVLGIPPALALALTRPPDRPRAHASGLSPLPLWLANYMLWHLPWVYDAALENPNTFLHLEHATYFLTGVARGGASSSTRRTDSAQAHGPATCSQPSSSEAPSASCWPSYPTRSTTSTSTAHHRVGALAAGALATRLEC